MHKPPSFRPEIGRNLGDFKLRVYEEFQLASTFVREKVVQVEIGSRVPDWGRRATRLAISVSLFGFLGHCLTFPPGNDQADLANALKQSCNWAAITCIVVTAPLIGKVAQVAVDRLCGTCIGGVIGYASFALGCYIVGEDYYGYFISIVAFVLVVATVYLAYRFRLEQLARFIQLTYCIVAYGAKPEKSAALLAAIRVGGIFAGGILATILAVVVLPRSASIEAIREMKNAITSLLELNQKVWQRRYKIAGHGHSRRKRHRRHGYSARLDLDSNSLGQASQLGSKAELELLLNQHSNGMAVGSEGEAECEKLFTKVYATLAKVEDNLAQTSGEVFIWHFWGHYFFLPGVHWFPARTRWHVPTADLQQLATCVRRLARILWTLLLDFEEGFDEDMEDVLQQFYPKQLLSELEVYQHLALKDLATAFPSRTVIPLDNLFTLGQVVDCLLQISDARARNALFKGQSHGSRDSGLGEEAPLPNESHVARPSSVGRTFDIQATANGAPTIPRASPRRSEEVARAPPPSIPLSGFAAATAGGWSVPGSRKDDESHEAAPLLGGAPLSTGAASSGRRMSSLLTSTISETLGRSLEQELAAASGSRLGGASDLPDSSTNPNRRFARLQSALLRSTSLHLQDVAPLTAPQPPQQQQPTVADPISPSLGAATLSSEAGASPIGRRHIFMVRDPAAIECSLSRTASCQAAARREHPALQQRESSPSENGIHLQVPPPSGLSAFAVYNISPSAGGKTTPHHRFPSAKAPSGPDTGAASLVLPAAPAPVLPRPPAGAPDVSVPSGAVHQLSSRASLPLSHSHFSTPRRNASASERSLSAGEAAWTDLAQAGSGPLPSVNAATNRLSTLIEVEPVAFPPTEEGYISQVRWYSFQFVMDELATELEESFLAVSSVLEKLPYPIW